MKHTFGFPFNLRFLVLLTMALLLLGLTGMAFAKKPSCPDHPSCGGPGDPGEPPSTVSNSAQWLGLISENLRSPCTTDGGTNKHGSYGCPVADEMYPVNYYLTDGVRSKKNDDASYCEGDSFVGDKFPDYRYVYAWEGPCVGETCDVFVYNTFYGYVNHRIAGVGLVHLIASGFISSSTEYPFDNPNPFKHPREIVIEEIDIAFHALGNDRKLATCNYSGWVSPPVLSTQPLE